MSRFSPRFAFVLGLALVAFPACEGEDTSDDHGDHADGHVHDDAGGAHADGHVDADGHGDHADAGEDHEHDAGEAADAPCTSEYLVFRDGLTAKAGDLTVKLVSVSPSPPRQKTPNDWTLQLVNADGTPATGFTIARPDSFMPVHNHHGRTPPKVGTPSGPGGALIEDIDFRMRGPWEVNFDVVPATGAAIPTTFRICVE